MVSSTALREPPRKRIPKNCCQQPNGTHKNNGLPANVPYMPTRGKEKRYNGLVFGTSSKARYPTTTPFPAGCLPPPAWLVQSKSNQSMKSKSRNRSRPLAKASLGSAPRGGPRCSRNEHRSPVTRNVSPLRRGAGGRLRPTSISSFRRVQIVP